MKKIAILGSTGSVGVNALRVISGHKDKFRVVGLTAMSNVELLAKQANRFKPRLLGLGDASLYNSLKRALNSPRKVLAGNDGLSEVAAMAEADIVLVAISGTAAIRPLLSAIKARKKIALANKEAIVSAGNIIMTMARRENVDIIPVDSEHNSIFQCMKADKKDAIKRIYLMGSGGPLKNVAKNIFDRLRPSRILDHPVWKMGKKISVDSATMMNKGLEVIEAHHLFGIDASKIEVLLHPEALIHSMVELVDGNVIANLFHPDMRFPIYHAFSYPERRPSRLPGIDFAKTGSISFQKPDRKKFTSLGLCYEAARRGGARPACLNSANEEAVGLYLNGKIKFTAITDIVTKVLKKHREVKSPSINEIFSVGEWSKEMVRSFARKEGG